MSIGKGVDEDLKELKVKLAKTVSRFNYLQKKNHSLPKPSKNKDLELLTGQVVLQQMRLLFDDLQKIKIEIEKKFAEIVHGDIGGVNEARHRLEKVRNDYIRLLFDVEEGRKSIFELKSFLKGENTCEDTPENNQSSKNSSDEISQENTTLVYQCQTTISDPAKVVVQNVEMKPTNNGPALTPPQKVPQELDPYLSYIFKIENENIVLKDQIDNLQSELSKVSTNFSQLNGSLGSVSNENKVRRSELEKLNEDVKSLRDRICVADKKAQVDVKMKKQKEMIEFSPDKVMKLQAELTSALKKSEGFQKELREAVDVIRKLTKQLETKDKEIDNLQTAKYSLEKICSKETERLKSSKSQEVELAQKLLEKTYHIENLLSENGELKRKVDSMSVDIENLEKKKESFNRKKEELNKKVESLVAENTELTKSLEDTRSELTTSKSISKRFENSLKSEQRNHSNTSSELTKAQKELSTFQKKFNAHKVEKENAREKATKLLVEVENIGKKLKDYEDKKNAFEKQVTDLKRAMEEMKETYESKFQEQNMLLEYSDNVRKEYEYMLNEPAKEIEELKSQMNELTKANNSLAEECVKIGQEHFKLQYEKTDLLKKGEMLEDTVKSLSAEVDELKNLRVAQTSEIRHLDSILCQLKEEKIISESHIKSNERRISSLMEQNKQLALDAQEHERGKSELKKELEETKFNLRTVVNENFNLKIKIGEPHSDSTETTSTSRSRPATVIPSKKNRLINVFYGQFDPPEHRKDSPRRPPSKKPSTTERKRCGILKWPTCSTAPANIDGRLDLNVYNLEFDMRKEFIASTFDIDDGFQNVFTNPIRETRSFNKLTD